MDPLLLLLPLIGLAAGFFLAWVLRGRAVARLAERLASAEEMRTAALKDLALAEQRAEQAAEWRSTAERLTLEREAARGELAALRAEQGARAEAYEAQIAVLKDAREQLGLQFADVGGRMLAEAQKAFLERADQRFGQSQEKADAQMKALLAPVETTLKRYEEGLGRVEKERVDSYAALREAVEQLRVGTAETRAETQKLVHALRNAPKARGRWGEQQLRNVLELAGLSAHADFQTEVSVGTEEGRLRPDVIIRLPGGRQLVIDAKCSLNAYLDAADAPDEAGRAVHLKAHAAAIRTHAQQLGGKDYWRHFGDAADYVVMFIPGEHFLTAALEQDGGLWDWAWERRVLLATPTNLVAIARTVASVWRQEKLAEDARDIAHLGKELYQRIGKVADYMADLGRHLTRATNAYNDLTKSFDGRLLSTARKFRDLNVDTGGKEIDGLETVDLIARAPESAGAAQALAATLPRATEADAPSLAG